MGNLVIKTGSGNITYSGKVYTGWTGGTKKLHIKTASNGTLHYPLTTNQSASQYCKLKIFYQNSTCYLARSENVNGTVSTWQVFNTRKSNYQVAHDFTSSLPFVGQATLGTIRTTGASVNYNADDVPTLASIYRGAFTVPIYNRYYVIDGEGDVYIADVPDNYPLAYSLYRYTHKLNVNRSAEVLGKTATKNTRSGTMNIYPLYSVEGLNLNSTWAAAYKENVKKTYFTKWLGTNTTKGTLSSKSTAPSNGFLKTLLSRFTVLRGTNYSNAASYNNQPIYSAQSTIQPHIVQMKGTWYDYPPNPDPYIIDERRSIADISILTSKLYATSSRELTSYKYSLRTYENLTRSSEYSFTSNAKANGTRYVLSSTKVVVNGTTHNANI